MEDDPAQRFAKANRVSIRAVLVSDQNVDVQAALAKAGILNPVAIPVVQGDTPDLSSGILGDGITPNVTGILEPDQSDIYHPEPPPHQAEDSEHQPDARHQPPPPVNLPAAFGMKPMAPGRKYPI